MLLLVSDVESPRRRLRMIFIEVTDAGGTGADLVLGLNLRSEGREDVRRYVASSGNPPMPPRVYGTSFAG